MAGTPGPSRERRPGKGEGSSDPPGLQPLPGSGPAPRAPPGSPPRPRLPSVRQGPSCQAPPETAELNFVVNVNFRSRGRVLKQADTALSLCVLVPLLSN